LYIPTSWTPLDVGWVELAWPYLSLLGVLMFFGTLSLLLSMLLPSRRLAATAAGLTLVGSYFLTSLARINADLEPMAKLSPLYYYQGGEAMDSFSVIWFVGLLALAILFALLAWWRFQRRDIRVGGEGGWAWSSLSRWLPRRFLARHTTMVSGGTMAQR
jgi:ABC-2 type transport system permease protein